MLQVRPVLLLLLVLVLLGRCVDEKNEAIIDQSYLQSSEYQAFKKSYEREKNLLVANQQALKKFLNQKIANRSQKNLSIPLVIDAERISAILKKSNSSTNLKNSVSGVNRSFHPIGKVDLDAYSFFLFLLCKETSYVDCTLWTAITRDRKVRDLQRVARHKKNVAASVLSTVTVDSNRQIKINTQRIIRYPIQQKNSNRYLYTISEDGRILTINK